MSIPAAGSLERALEEESHAGCDSRPGLFRKDSPLGQGCWEPGVEAGLCVDSPLGSCGGPRGGASGPGAD